MALVKQYYIVPKDLYEKCTEQEHTLDEKIDKLPKGAKLKALEVLEQLKGIVHWDTHDGEVIGLEHSIFDYINYSVRGKNKPSDWQSFVPNLISIPISLVCEKVKREIKRLKRKHGREIRAEGLD